MKHAAVSHQQHNPTTGSHLIEDASMMQSPKHISNFKLTGVKREGTQGAYFALLSSANAH